MPSFLPLDHPGFFRFWTHYLQGICESGLTQPLDDFSTEGDFKQSLSSWSSALKTGCDYEMALSRMTPLFPKMIQELLVLGHVQSCLDKVVRELQTLYEQPSLDEDALSRLLSQLQFDTSSEMICLGCAESVLYKIWQHALIENATEVLLSQEDELFFHQRYIGARVVYLREPCHSKNFYTLYRWLSGALSQASLSLKGLEMTLESELGDIFVLSHATHSLKLTFEGV